MSEDLLFVRQEEDIFPPTSSGFRWTTTPSRASSGGIIELLRSRIRALKSLDAFCLVDQTGQDILNTPRSLEPISSTSTSTLPWVSTFHATFQPETLDAFSSFLAVRERTLERLLDLSVGDDAPVYEPDPQRVNLDRLRRLRGIGAHESDDLYDWYAQKEE